LLSEIVILLGQRLMVQSSHALLQSLELQLQHFLVVVLRGRLAGLLLGLQGGHHPKASLLRLLDANR
jgi:hypothetical protein